MSKKLIALFGQKRLFCIVFALIFGAFLIPSRTQAFTFNKNLIISNDDLTNYRSMSASKITSFLKGFDSSLLRITSAGKSAIDIIVEASNNYHLSPKFFLVMMQKEQSLVTTKNAKARQINYATGYGCPDSTGCGIGDSGFATQIYGAAATFQKYLTNHDETGLTMRTWGWGVGRTKETGSDSLPEGIPVTPENEATAALYTYNPYVGAYGNDPRGIPYGANSNFARIWQNWFTVTYPDGILVRTAGSSDIWLIKGGKRHLFQSRAAFETSYNYNRVTTISETSLYVYPYGTPIKYPEYSLLQAPDGGVSMLANGKLRPIPSREVFDSIGFNTAEIITGVSFDELSLYPKGKPIKSAEASPQSGYLVKSKETPKIRYIENGKRHLVASKEILKNRFPGIKLQDIKVVSDSKVLKNKVGQPVLFKDGEVVKLSTTDKTRYFISNGKKRKIQNTATFAQLGLKKKNIIATTSAALKVHKTGKVIDFSIKK